MKLFFDITLEFFKILTFNKILKNLILNIFEFIISSYCELVIHPKFEKNVILGFS